MTTFTITIKEVRDEAKNESQLTMEFESNSEPRSKTEALLTAITGININEAIQKSKKELDQFFQEMDIEHRIVETSTTTTEPMKNKEEELKEEK